MTLNNLGRGYQATGRNEHAIELYTDAREQFSVLQGPLHPQTLVVRHNLGVAHAARGDVERAVDIFAELLTDRRHVLGPDHPQTRATRDALERVRRERASP
jgi:tetratricopeptide (TPR) repeat protein